MFQILISGFFALLGGFLGAHFTRQTQHHKWLLERRAESFANFIQKLSEGRNKAIEIYNSAPDDISIDQAKLVEACLPALDYALIVKFYLPEEARDYFDECVTKYVRVLTDPQCTREARKMITSSFRDAIQELFEKELSLLEPKIGLKIRKTTSAFMQKLKTRLL